MWGRRRRWGSRGGLRLLLEPLHFECVSLTHMVVHADEAARDVGRQRGIRYRPVDRQVMALALRHLCIRRPRDQWSVVRVHRQAGTGAGVDPACAHLALTRLVADCAAVC